ncbi:MAG TPA: hypothetical protein VMJ90_09225 [Anaerolineales bacterium]|nr:hypothetical protein [Anaerolineales bacterium]
MDRQTRRTPHSQALNLLPLASALIAAEKSTPPRAPRPSLDPDEALAARLIENIKHPQAVLFPEMRIEPPRPFHRKLLHEMAGSDV